MSKELNKETIERRKRLYENIRCSLFNEFDVEDIIKEVDEYAAQRCKVLQEENDLLEAREVAWSNKVKYLEEENERLKDLVKTMYYACSGLGQKLTDAEWEKFKTENKL